MIPQMRPIFGNEEAQAVCDYVKSGGWLTEYIYTEELEKQLSEYLNIPHVIMMSSGTMALYAALMVLGIGSGDYVPIPNMTMIATANAVRMTGAYPVFCDVEPSTLCLDISTLWSDLSEGTFTPDTKAMIYVSLNGRCGDMGKVQEFCQTHDLYLIEDAAQSLGSTYKGQALGTFGDIGCFSLSCQKVISTGNGGFCVTKDDDLARKLRMFKNFGRASGGTDVYESFGINAKFTDLQAIIGIEQFKKLPDRLLRKSEIWHRYKAGLYDMGDVELIPTNDGTVLWFFDVLVNDRENLMSHLKSHGIGTRPFYPALHKTPVYEYRGWLPVSEDVARTGLWLPSSVDLTDEDIDFICGKVADFYG